MDWHGIGMTILLIVLIVGGVFLAWCLGKLLDWIHKLFWGGK